MFGNGLAIANIHGGMDIGNGCIEGEGKQQHDGQGLVFVYLGFLYYL